MVCRSSTGRDKSGTLRHNLSEHKEYTVLHHTALAAVLKRDRIVVLSGLGGIAALAWLYTIHLAQAMPEMTMPMAMDMAMPHRQAWTGLDVLFTLFMWIVMMVAMMVPSAAPMILMYATMRRRHQEQARPFGPTGLFLLGYLVVWAGFSAVATLAQWGLHTVALLSTMMGRTGPVLGGLLLLAAGIFQWTPLKAVCLTHCRSPLGFFMTHWRDGARGAWLMGLQHGGYCLGCCWLLMVLLFVAGVMNLLWVAGIAVLILLEKVVPRGELVGRIAGVGLGIGGVVLLSHAWHG